jgi:hypothetical protein
MNLLEILLLGYLVAWPFYVTVELHRLDMFMRARYGDPISRLQFFAELTGRFLIISFLTSLSVDLYIAGLSPDATSAETYPLWQLHVSHTCMLRGLANRASCGHPSVDPILVLSFKMKHRALHSWLRSPTSMHRRSSFFCSIRQVPRHPENLEL